MSTAHSCYRIIIIIKERISVQKTLYFTMLCLSLLATPAKAFDQAKLDCAQMLSTKIQQHIELTDDEQNSLFEADLSGADLSKLNLSRLNMVRANLRNTTLDGTRFDETILHDANFRGAHARPYEDPSYPGAMMPSVTFSKARMTGAKLMGTFFNFAWFGSTDLTNAKFNNAQLERAFFAHAILINSSFYKADLIKADLCNTILSGASFRKAILTGTWFKRANMKPFIQRDGSQRDVDFTDAEMKGAIFFESRGASPTNREYASRSGALHVPTPEEEAKSTIKMMPYIEPGDTGYAPADDPDVRSYGKDYSKLVLAAAKAQSRDAAARDHRGSSYGDDLRFDGIDESIPAATRFEIPSWLSILKRKK